MTESHQRYKQGNNAVFVPAMECRTSSIPSTEYGMIHGSLPNQSKCVCSKSDLSPVHVGVQHGPLSLVLLIHFMDKVSTSSKDRWKQVLLTLSFPDNFSEFKLPVLPVNALQCKILKISKDFMVKMCALGIFAPPLLSDGQSNFF